MSIPIKEMNKPQGIVLPRKGCHRPIELPCHSVQGNGYCANCIYWQQDFEGAAYGKPKDEPHHSGEVTKMVERQTERSE